MYVLGVRPNEKISKLFSPRGRKRYSSHAQCIAGFEETGSTETHVRQRKRLEKSSMKT